MQLIGTIPPLPQPGIRRPIRIESRGSCIQLQPSCVGDATHDLVNVLGKPFITHRVDLDRCISRALQSDGFWEFAETAIVATLLRAGGTVLDLGANIGYYAIQMARMVGAAGIVYAAEPEPVNFSVLVANALLATNQECGLARFELQRFALGSTCGKDRLHVSSANLGLHSFHWQSNAPRQPIDVPKFTLDRLRFGTNDKPPSISTRIDLIKADTQGSELDILLGGERTISTDRPSLILEFEPYISGEDRCRDTLAWLDDHSYRRLRLFYANESRPAKVLSQLTMVLTPRQIQRKLSQGELGAYCSLLAPGGD